MAHSYNLDISADALIARLTGSLHEALAEKIKQELMKTAEGIVREVAMELARNLVTSLDHVREFERGCINVRLSIDGVEQALTQLEKKS